MSVDVVLCYLSIAGCDFVFNLSLYSFNKTGDCRINYDEERKEMFYLTTYSTHFYLQLYGIGHMVKVHLDSER